MISIENATTQVHRVFIKASAEKIWEAIIDPEFNGKYGYGTPNFYELKPGGRFYVKPSEEMLAQGPMPEVIIDGEVLEFDPPHKLVQTWHAIWDPEAAEEPAKKLTWEITEEEYLPGTCRLTVTHELEGAPATARQVAGDNPNAGGGWPYILSDLKTFLETGSALRG